MKIICSALYIAILFFATIDLYAQFGGTITGFVYGPDRIRLKQINVELLDEFSRSVARVQTDGSGRYNFTNIRAGMYKVKVMPLGTPFEEKIVDVEIISFARETATGSVIQAGSSRVQQDIMLEVSERNKQSIAVNQVVYTQEVPEEAKKLYQAATSDLENNRSAEAIKNLTAAIEKFPTYYAALETLGLYYMKTEKYSEAIPYLKKASEIYDKSHNLWYGLGYSNLAVKNLDEAAKAMEKAVVATGATSKTYLLYGIILRQSTKFTEAEKAFVKAKDLAKNTDAETNWNLALLYAHNLKKYDMAANELERFLKNDPNNANKENIKKLIAQFKEKANSK